MEQIIESISLLDWVLIGALLALFCYQLYYYVRYMAGVQRRVRHQTKKRFRWRESSVSNSISDTSDETIEDSSNVAQSTIVLEAKEVVKPGVSVVVCARNEEENLQHYLQALLSQRYPEFEVIVVNDASLDNTQVVLDQMTQRFRNLRLTFVPADAWVRSSKKLALTLAAKAAKYDYLLLTDADCVPESPYWISEMMKGFVSPEIDIVLGYGAYFEEPRWVNRLVQYDTIFNAMQWLGMAMSRHPYMGVGRNLAYRKSAFLNKGFSGLLGEKAGDDDLLVNRIANRHNTEVVLTPDSYTWSIPKQSFADWRRQKYRHLSVSPVYRTATKLRLLCEPLTRGLWYALIVTIVVLAAMGILTHPLVWALAAILFVMRLVLQMSLISRAAHILGAQGFGMSVLLYDVYLPLSNLGMLIKHRLHRKQELKW